MAAAANLVVSPLRWFILVLLAIGVMISFIDRTSISTALALPSFKQHFGLSDVDRGWVSSTFFWSYAILQVPLAGSSIDTTSNGPM